MNIGVNARLLLKDRLEGIGRYIYETTRRMVASHPEDQFYFFFDRPYSEDFIFADNVTPVVVHPQARHPLLYYVWFEWMLPHYFNKFDIDVFYSGDTYMTVRKKIPTVIISHDIAYKHFPKHIPLRELNYYEKWFAEFHKRADRIVAVSEFTKQDIIDTYQLDPESISIGYNACSELFCPINFKRKTEIQNKFTQGKPYFVYLGSIHPRKNIANLISAFSLFKDELNTDHKLLLIGRKAWNCEQIETVYNQSKYKEDIIFLGSMKEEVPGVVAASEALVYISLFEGFGVPILEGFRSGVPVITSASSSMPEVAGEAALLADPNNIREISHKMKEVLQPNVRDVLIKAGIKRVNDFSWSDTASIIYQNLKDIS